ncbi:NADH-quinone oxidoreductase subunit J [Thermoflavifilum thermophilum]|uniref:NADH-quinone oxidoreductase subunit J n=1 Tax=Thermoflavifilum thermophilum TaxID=1393122 RepID=A0A1I7N6S7_9BACT|nr:NADH-quinone oxidoreductase subunit J [Thermoflavifilum thermophilum]SFV30368.1 NADH dehydrogenase subunit J [Thermoflavifilum thermophilum]
MNIIFYLSAVVAIYCTLRAVFHKHAVHALLYLIVSLLAVAVVFFVLGAPFLAALEVIIYAGAIMVLFVFVVMMLNRGEAAIQQEKAWLQFSTWAWPAVFVLLLFAEWLYLLFYQPPAVAPVGGNQSIMPQQVGEALFTRYLLGVEMAAMLLMAGVIGAYHIGKQKQRNYHRYLEEEENLRSTASEKQTQQVI